MRRIFAICLRSFTAGIGSPLRSQDPKLGLKPSRSPVDLALEKLGTYPGETLMIGDSPYDIESALACGVQTIALRCGGWTDEELPGAIAIYDHPLDLLEHFEASPLGAALTTSLQRAKSA